MKTGGVAASQSDLVKWLDAVDALTGQGAFESSASPNLARGVELARESGHPDAQWLASLFPADALVSCEEMRRVLTAQGDDDARACLIRAFLPGADRAALLRRATALGYGPAMTLADAADVQEKFALSERAAAWGDRRGHFWQGCLRVRGVGCELNTAAGIASFRIAAELGHAEAQVLYGEMACQWSDPERYRWWGRAARRNCSAGIKCLLLGALKQVRLYEEGEKNGRLVFEIGAACKGHVEPIASREGDEAKFQAAEKAVQLYDRWCDEARAAIRCWIGGSLQLGVVKDIRLLIAQKVWEERFVWSCKAE